MYTIRATHLLRYLVSPTQAIFFFSGTYTKVEMQARFLIRSGTMLAFRSGMGIFQMRSKDCD